ncbi:NADP-dependent oxidoreductase [Anopheles sinensis]|uniref:NADP-dependent oxidoreductase n=1 Tax=Anopheles sinensis TaxID=74873 RepID=A0A084VX46_ANOSI|nr:NADP-dependent oxidoreductase [Anopheles sinensis]
MQERCNPRVRCATATVGNLPESNGMSAFSGASTIGKPTASIATIHPSGAGGKVAGGGIVAAAVEARLRATGGAANGAGRRRSLQRDVTPTAQFSGSEN